MKNERIPLAGSYGLLCFSMSFYGHPMCPPNAPPPYDPHCPLAMQYIAAI